MDINDIRNDGEIRRLVGMIASNLTNAIINYEGKLKDHLGSRMNPTSFNCPCCGVVIETIEVGIEENFTYEEWETSTDENDPIAGLAKIVNQEIWKVINEIQPAWVEMSSKNVEDFQKLLCFAKNVKIIISNLKLKTEGLTKDDGEMLKSVLIDAIVDIEKNVSKYLIKDK